MMKQALLLFTALFLTSCTLLAQPFAQVSISAQGAGRPAVAWGDYDNDGDLDLALSGMLSNGSYLSRIYRNDAGSFIADTNTFAGTKDGSAMWGDFDNDADLDLLISGETEENGNICLIYRNNDGVFDLYDAGLPGMGYGDASWGDYDNDGDLDILIAGNWLVDVYENNEGIFEPTGNDFGYLQNVKSSWGDFDGDGDLDILLIGDTGSGYFADVFLNNEGVYERANLEMTGLFSGSADLIDYDNDGDMDISISGFNLNLEPRFLLYTNEGDGTVSQHFTVMEGIATGTVDWGDYDNDGDLDVLMAGKNAACGASIAKVYNNDDGFFMMENGAQLDGAIRCAAAWADYDNDGDLDFLLSGMTLSEYPFTRLYRNEAGTNEYSSNTAPVAPDSLESVADGQTVTLSWAKAMDNETPQDGLSYNVRIGSEPGTCQIIAPLSDATTGYRTVQGLGNANMKTSLTVSGLEEGTYYWSVQAVDQAYAGSAFSVEQSFVIIETDLDNDMALPEVNIYPVPAREYIHIELDSPGYFLFRIVNVSGQLMYTGELSSGDPIDISSLKEGIYFVQLITDGHVHVQRIIKE